MKKKSIKVNRPTPPNINDSLLAHESWKIFQVISEFVEGYERLVHMQPSISLFGSARTKPNHKYYKLAQAIGETLSNAGYSVITGGGPGLMEAVNKGAYEGKSFSVGLNIVLDNQCDNEFQDVSLRFRHFFTRRVMFVKYATAFVTLPGGYGTLDELSEVLALVQTKKTRIIPIILVNRSYWEPLVEWFRTHMLDQEMIDPQDLDIFYYAETPEDIMNIISDFYKGKEKPLKTLLDND